MSSPVYQTSIPWGYAWTYPGCPCRILLSLSVVEQLRLEFLERPPGDREAGGLLLGIKQPGVVQIHDFIPLPPQKDASGPHFSVPPKWLDEIVARCPSDRKVVGYYRTDIDQRIQLGQDDLDAIQQRFQDPSSVFLVIALTDGPAASAGFFYWQSGVVSPNPRLTFPFSAAALSSGPWPTEERDPSVHAKPVNVYSQMVERIRSGDPRVLTGFAVVAVLVALLIIISSGGWINSTTASPPGLGLQVKRDGSSFLITWNRSARAILDGKAANLVIADPSREPIDGSSDPLFLQLTPDKLHSGSMTYTSFSPDEKVLFRLDVVGASGKLSSESLASVPPAPIDSATQPVSAQRLRRAARELAQLERRVASHPAAAAVPPIAASRAYIPPKAEQRLRNPGRTILAAPPEMPASTPPAQPPPMPAAPIAAASSSDFALAVEQTEPRASSPAPPVQPAPAPAPSPSQAGVLTVTSEPSGAEVQINSVRAGYTPLSIQISPVGLGFTVTVIKSGFLKWSLQTFATAQPYSLHAQLHQIPR